MALLTLKDIGKIYVSDGSVAVGIRGVNLSFDRGEFVAVTGKSGSGKSTLLNVISGMDSYEEGELFIKGEPTSHYLQPDWEEYREKYISFIFQDYNIIESFTVLENVELALLHIEDKSERRKRAMELIRRVGLESSVKQKGSRLSGGQKQRTVIARALAKDSPIILADEPTGNLDSETSKEIIKLLYEVSLDKLVIVVTHNLDDFAEYATRHIRIFDGAIESDRIIKSVAFSCNEDHEEQKNPALFAVSDKDSRRRERIHNYKSGLTLGRSIFFAKPKLSVFLCLLMLIGTLGIFLITSLCGDAGNIFKPYYMFSHIDGRLVLTTRDGSVLSDEDVKRLAEEYGAESYLRYDVLLDQGDSSQLVIPVEDSEVEDIYRSVNTVFGKDYGKRIIGRYPEDASEVFLYLPISLKPYVGEDSLAVTEVRYGGVRYDLVGVKYFYDNNLSAECLFTEEGFRVATAIHYLLDRSDFSISVEVTPSDGSGARYTALTNITPSFDMLGDKIYVDPSDIASALWIDKNEMIEDYALTVNFIAKYYSYNYYYGESYRTYTFERTFKDSERVSEKPIDVSSDDFGVSLGLVISDELLCEIAEEVLAKSYKQVSFFFEDDKAAKEASEKMHDAGYVAVTSDTTYEPDADTALSNVLSSILLTFVWILSILFLAFFINLCSARALGAFKADMAIMRSMGISVSAIRVGMYVRMLISLVPAFITVAISAIILFTSPKTNEYFVYLYWWQYTAMFIGMLVLTARITHNQIKRLFGESVKKSLKGDGAV